MRLLALTLTLCASAPTAVADDFDRPPIRYSETAPDDAVSRLGRELRAGTVTLAHEKGGGYLRAVLKKLDVPASSQVFVFSKTSLQRRLIGPDTPRAIYFNDDVAVAFCRGGAALELAADDPDLGAVFSTLDQDPAGRAAVTRQTDRCLSCHAGSANQGVPGSLARSVSADAGGELLLARGTKRVDHSTPFAERWGGWYVTGTSGKQTHLGNAVIVGGVPSRDGTNVTDLRPSFDTAKYLTPHSDLVALMVLEHQAEVHNRLTRANYQTRVALAQEAEINAALGLPAGARAESVARRVVWACEPLVEALLFSEEAALTGPVAGTSGFAAEFAARGPFDARGRGLRQFDLTTRLFRLPLSYVAYSKHFDGLPPEAKAQVYRRLWEVLTGKDRSKPFAHLAAADRLAALEVFRATKPGLPAYWAE